MNNLVLFNSAIDVFSAFLVFIIGALITVSLSSLFNASRVRVLGLYVWHTLFALAYAYVTTLMAADAKAYYFNSLGQLHDFRIGTRAVEYLTAIFSQGFGLSYLGTFLVFNIFGAIGLVAVDAALRHATVDKSKFVKQLALIVVLLPSMSFWTGAIGKDSVAFLATGLALWSAIHFKQRYVMMFVAVVVMFMVRPHIAGIMVSSLSIALVLSGGLTYLKIVSSVVSLIGLVFIVPVMFNYIGLSGDVSVELIQENIERRQSYNQSGGGGIDISSMSLPEQMFSYLFRPLPHDAHSIFALISSIQNLILLAVFLLFLLSLLKIRKSTILLMHPEENRWFLIIFAVVTMLVLVVTTANMGISVRQKWMFMPIFLYFFFLFMRVKLTWRVDRLRDAL